MGVIHIVHILEQGIAHTGYVVPGCVEDGAWLLWEHSSVAAAIVAVARLGAGGLGTRED